MFGHYIDAIVRAYLQCAMLNPRLGDLSPASLKRECKAICMERFNKKDEYVLKTFFGFAEGQKGYWRAIHRMEASKFKPLVSILKGETGDPRKENVELLAWLFDVQPRPFNRKADYTQVALNAQLMEEPETTPAEPIKVVNPAPAPVEQNEIKKSDEAEKEHVKPEKPEWRWKLVAAALLVFAGLATIGLLVKNKNNNKYAVQSSLTAQCMYWAGDRYISVDCNQKIKNARVIALDTILLNNFFRINTPDTIGYSSIGRLWYAKTKGEVEFFTATGYHPVDLTMPLKPVTKYMIDNHVFRRNGEVANLGIAQLEKTGNQGKNPATYQSGVSRTTGAYGQCNGITKKKARCSRNAKPNGYCWQHGGS